MEQAEKCKCVYNTVRAVKHFGFALNSIEAKRVEDSTHMIKETIDALKDLEPCIDKSTSDQRFLLERALDKVKSGDFAGAFYDSYLASLGFTDLAIKCR